jgi:anti-sigma B factor antagonist
MDELKIDASTSARGVRVLRLNGPLTLSTLFDFQKQARESTQAPIVLDLTDVPYMDSAGLGAVLGLLASCQRGGRGFGIVGVAERLQMLFRVTHVDGMIPTFSSVDQAEQHVAKSANA